MTGISKYFNDLMRNRKCQEIVHPSTSKCFYQSFQDIILKGGITNVKLFLPLVLLPLAAKAKNLTVNDVVDSFKSFGIATLQSIANAQAIVLCLCLYYKIFGKYNYYTCFFLPGAIGSLTNCVLPSKLGQIHSNAFASISLETGIRGLDNSLMNTLKKSKIAGTLCFMTLSSIILYYLRLNKTSTFWHIQPLQFKEINKEDHTPSPCLDKIVNCDSRVCVHNESCDNYIISGIKTYAKYGLIIDLIKIIVSRFNGLRINPWNTVKLIIKKSDFMFFKFLATYAGVHRLSSCLLNRYFVNDSAKGTLLAGFLSGGAYYMCPNYRFFTHAAATAVQLSWINFINSDGKMFEKLRMIPWRVIVYCLNLGYLLHMRIFYPYLLPKFGIKVFDLTSAGKTNELEKRIRNIMFGIV